MLEKGGKRGVSLGGGRLTVSSPVQQVEQLLRGLQPSPLEAPEGTALAAHIGVLLGQAFLLCDRFADEVTDLSFRSEMIVEPP